MSLTAIFTKVDNLANVVRQYKKVDHQWEKLTTHPKILDGVSTFH